jgi:hypothetical protein
MRGMAVADKALSRLILKHELDAACSVTLAASASQSQSVAISGTVTINGKK